MMLPVQFRRAAEADIDEVYRWYEREREGLGADFLLCLEEAIEKVRRNPEIYPIVHKAVRRAFIRRFPYGLFYVLEDGEIAIIGVFHARRDPRHWQSRV